MKENNQEIMQDNMQEKIQKKIAREDKKYSKKFWIILIVAFIVGGLSGWFLAAGENFLRKASELPFVEFWAQFQLDMVLPFRMILVASGAILWLLSGIYYIKARKMWKEAEDQDDIYDKVDSMLGHSMMFANVMTVTNFAWMGVACYMVPKDTLPIWTYWGTLLAFSLYVGGSFYMQRKVVNMIKEMNPEKRGSVFDMKFQKVWDESQDEAERLQSGIGAYRTVQIMSYVCMVIMLVLVMACMVFEIGVLPIFVTGLIWLLLTVIFQVECAKAGKMLNK